MRLLEFSFKNIFSYGNKLQKFEIKPNEPNLLLIHGKRGGGKSSIKEAIVLSAYGKSPNRSLKNIPNRLNKNAYLHTKFVNNQGDIIEIERGIEPSILNLKINGEIPPKLPNKNKINEYIENVLINIPFNVFCNTITISVNEFKSFVSLAPIDKRKIIDKIFGVGEINEMNVLNKIELQKYNQKYEVANISIQRDKNLIETTKFQLEELKKEVKASNENKIEELKKSIEINLELRELEKKQFQQYSTIITSITEEVTSFVELKNKCISQISEIDKKIEVYNKNKCPHCLSNLTDESHLTIKDKLVNLKSTTEDKLNDILIDIKKSTEKLQEPTTLQNQHKTNYNTITYTIESDKKLLSQLENENTSNTSLESSKLSELINTLESNIEKCEIEKESIQESILVLNELSKILSDDGMKKLFMAKIIPMINQRILERSSEIEYPYSFEFDANFDPVIMHLGQIIELESLSTGEQKEMNLITLFSILDIIIMKLGLNFIFLDEVFTSLDSESIYKVVSMLRSFTDKHKITVFAISHDPLPSEFFDSIISVKKDKHFSDITF